MRRPRGGRGSHLIGRAGEVGGSTSQQRRRRETKGEGARFAGGASGSGILFLPRARADWLVGAARSWSRGGGGWRRESSSDREHEHEATQQSPQQHRGVGRGGEHEGRVARGGDEWRWRLRWRRLRETREGEGG
jgi:hypothetical protein